MVYSIQRKITTVYSSWLLATLLIIFAYVFLIKGVFFYTYNDAMPWITRYILLALLGNICTLGAVAYFLKPNSEALKFLIVYEIIFIIILALSYRIVFGHHLPDGIGSINFETILNAVLPFIFIFVTLFEFVFSKALHLMETKNI